jgi:hypothetical protein
MTGRHRRPLSTWGAALWLAAACVAATEPAVAQSRCLAAKYKIAGAAP